MTSIASFKSNQFSPDISVWGRWYCLYRISDRNLEEMIGNRGREVDHSKRSRWVHKYALELDKRCPVCI